ncbi:MAG: aldehyde oxidase, partial [Thermoprotei archaeon]
MSGVPEYVRTVEEIFEKFKDKELLYVGKTSQRWDAIAKVTGKALFTADFLKFYKNLVYVYSVRTKYAHAVIKKLDVSEAAKYPGVLKVLTAKDI